MNTSTVNAEMITKAAPGRINGFCAICDTFGPIILADDFLCEKHAEKWLAKEAALALFNNDWDRDRELENDPRFAAIWTRWGDRAAVTGGFAKIGRELEKLYNA